MFKRYFHFFTIVLICIVVTMPLGCSQEEARETRKALGNVKSKKFGENYFLYDKEYAAAFLLTDDTETLSREGEEIRTKKFIKEIAPAISRKKIVIGKDYYLIPFVTFPFPEKYHTDDPLRGTQIEIQAELYDSYGTPVKEWDPTSMFDLDVDIDFQMLRKGKAFPINLDQSYAYGMYEARLVVTDKLNNKMIEFKFPFELVHSLNG